MLLLYCTVQMHNGLCYTYEAIHAASINIYCPGGGFVAMMSRWSTYRLLPDCETGTDTRLDAASSRNLSIQSIRVTVYNTYHIISKTTLEYKPRHPNLPRLANFNVFNVLCIKSKPASFIPVSRPGPSTTQDAAPQLVPPCSSPASPPPLKNVSWHFTTPNLKQRTGIT